MKGKIKEIRPVLRQSGKFGNGIVLGISTSRFAVDNNGSVIYMPCFLSPLTHAATQITLDGGYEIRFDNGKFDTETFNMQITNLEVLKNGKRYWNADAILLKTSLLADGRTLIVEKLENRQLCLVSG